MRVVVAGSSGFLGTALRRRLVADGHEVVRLVRRPVRAADESRWDPATGVIDQAVVDGADAVVNVAGSTLFGNAHSAKWARDMRESRVGTTLLLAEAVARAARSGSGPAFVAQNATGWYGDHGSMPVDESSDSRGDTFMTVLCRDWREATSAAVEAGARVCVMHTAPVMDRRILPFKAMVPLFKMGLGARIGSGSQYLPVVSTRDWAAAAAHLVTTEVEGPHLVCAPSTPTHREFTEAVARAVGKQARLVVPPVLMKVAGRMESEVTVSTRARPEALLRSGFGFADEDADAVAETGLHV